MADTIRDRIAELTIMRASGEISAWEFVAAKERLQRGTSTPTSPAKARTAFPPTPKRSMFKWRYAAMAVAAWWIIGSLYGSEEGVEVLASTYSEDWPYPPHEEGLIQCRMETIRNALGQERRRPVVTIILGGMEYWLNGAAGDTKRYPDPRPMNPRDPVHGGYAGKTPSVVSGFIQSGLSLCGYK